MEHTTAIELRHITKRFGKVVANDDISLEIRRGEILSLLGENGSGKTTLMNMLSGIYFPDEGQIYIHGKPVTIASPKDAFNYGIGMIHQHFKLVDVFTATENIVLGLEGKLISVPRCITSDCGMAWSAPPELREHLETRLQEAGIETAGFYELPL